VKSRVRLPGDIISRLRIHHFFWNYEVSCFLLNGSMFNNCWVAGGWEGLGYACYGGIQMTMTSYTKRCTKTRRVCWCKFGRNPRKSFCVICILVSLPLVPRQGFPFYFACLSIYILAISPELFVFLSIYENAETLSPSRSAPADSAVTLEVL